MKLVIQGEAFDLEEAIGEAAIGDLYTLKIKLGISIKTINHTFDTMGELAKSDDFDAMDLLDNPDVMLNLQGLIWLAKRKTGVAFTIEDAGRVPFSALTFESEEDDELEAEAEVDPKVPDSEVVESAPE